MNKTEFLQVVSIQRSKLIDEYQKPGWNLWVLSGAFASLFWILISLLEENNFHLNSAIFVAIFFYISYNILRPLYKFISNSSSKGNGKYVYLRTEMANSLLSIIFLLATLIFIYIFIIKNVTNCPAFVMILFHIFFFLIFIVFMVLFLVSFVNIPISSNNNSPFIKKKGSLIFSLIFALALNLLYIIYIQLPCLDEYTSVKLGLVLFSLHFITFKLLSTTERNLLLNQIDELIDDVTFDNKSVTAGEETLKLIIYGLQFNKIVSPLINEHLELTKSYKDNYDLIIERLNQLKEETYDKQKTLLIDAIFKQVAEAERTYPLVEKSKNKILKRLIFYQFSEQNNPDFNNIQTLLNRLQSERNDKLAELKKTFEIFSKQ